MGLFKLINDEVQKRFDGQQETYQNEKKNRPYIILFGSLLFFLGQVGFLPPSMAFLSVPRGPNSKGHFSDRSKAGKVG